MFTSRDYDYQTKIGELKTRLEVASKGTFALAVAIADLGDKHKVPQEEIDEIREGIAELREYLERK